MYRTSSLNDDIEFQRIVSKEIANGFNQIFMIENGDPKLINSCFEIFCDEAGIRFGSKLEEDLLIYKLLGMYAEVKDQEHRFVFDEQGEWLFSKILTVAYERIEEQRETWFDFETDEDPGLPTMDKLWPTSLNAEEIAYIDKVAERYCQDILSEILYELRDESDEAYQQEVLEEWKQNRKDLARRITYFPLMAEELVEDAEPEFLFWDRDFCYIGELGMEGFRKLAEDLKMQGRDLGMYVVDEFTQLLTGSTLFELEEE